MSRLFGTYLVALMLLPQSALAVWETKEVTDEFTDEITYYARGYDMEAYCFNRRIGVRFGFGEKLDLHNGYLISSVRFDDGKIRHWSGEARWADWRSGWLYLDAPARFLKEAIASKTVRVRAALLLEGSKTLTIDMSGAEEAIAAAFASGGCKPLKRKPSKPSD